MTMISDITDQIANLDERVKALEAKLNPPAPQAPAEPPGPPAA